MVKNRRYLREPRWGFFSADWRFLAFLRFGFVITNVPLPTYSAFQSFSSAKPISPGLFVLLL